jgi:hypothetical protein
MIAHLAAARSRPVIAYAILFSERFKMLVDASGGLIPGFLAWLAGLLPPPADDDMMTAWAPRSWPRILPPSRTEGRPTPSAPRTHNHSKDEGQQPMTPPRLKVGDRVIDVMTGATGEVITVERSAGMARVKFDDGVTKWFQHRDDPRIRPVDK